MNKAKLDTGLCGCGSALRRLRCCEADVAGWPEAAALLDIQAQEATKLFNEKKYPEAEALALQLLDLAPNQRLALRVMFEIRKGQNRVTAAEVLARRLAVLPGTAALRAAANTQLAQFLIQQGRHADALEPASAAVIATPKEASAHHVLGVVLTETGQVPAGELHYRKALALLGRDDGLVLANTAWNLKLQGRMTEAVELYARALALRPDNKRGVGGFAQVEMARGDSVRAKSLLDEALARWPEERTLRLLRALADLATGHPQAVLERIAEPAEQLLAAELSARGQALARLGHPAEAVAQYAHAKKMLRERNGQNYQPAEIVAKAEAYKAYFTAGRMQPLPRAPVAPGPRPVFLLGFPRSGTSLLEELLARVPGFAAGDEFCPIAELVTKIPQLTGANAPYPEALDQVMIGGAQDVPGQLRAQYQLARARIGLARPGVSFITDRAAGNLWHLGLVKLLFPEAPVIHVIRHPLDIMLSILSQDRKLEANCHASMAAAARHYALSMEMIKHYRAELSLRYLPVRYEDLVAAPAAVLGRVLAFTGVDAAGLPPETDLRENAGIPRDPVPAHYAVREKMHARGVERYREYEALMPNLFAEVREILNPWIAELGYGATP